MGLWKTVRREVVGAWRSARYDVDRHIGHHRAVKLRHAETAEIVVRQIVWQNRPSPHRRHRPVEMPWAGRRTAPLVTPRAPRRRAVGTTGVALLVAGGAAGTYLAVAGSLVGMNADAHDPAGPPLAAPEKSSVSATSPQEHFRIKPDKRSNRRAAPAPIAPEQIPPVAAAAPTPAAAAAPTAAPTPTTSIEATPTPTASPTPSPSVSASTTDDQSAQFTGRHRWQHPDQTGDGR